MNGVQKIVATCIRWVYNIYIEMFGKQLPGKFCDANTSGLMHCTASKAPTFLLLLPVHSLLDFMVQLNDCRERRIPALAKLATEFITVIYFLLLLEWYRWLCLGCLFLHVHPIISWKYRFSTCLSNAHPPCTCTCALAMHNPHDSSRLQMHKYHEISSYIQGKGDGVTNEMVITEPNNLLIHTSYSKLWEVCCC